MNKKPLVSAILNYSIFAIVLVCLSVVIFHRTEDGFLTFRHVVERFFDATKYFTVQSNILCALISLVFAISETQVLCGRAESVPTALVIIKHALTVGVEVTFLVVALYLSPINANGYFELFSGYNFFFHFFIPLLAAITLVFFDGKRFPFPLVLLGLIPFILYGVFYLVNAFTHAESGKVVARYDWYYLLQGGAVFSAIAITAMIALVFATSLLLWLPLKK